MAWTLTTLKTAIQSYLETTETEFVSNLDNIIIQAEQGIVTAVQHPAFRQYSNLSTVASTSTVDISSEAPLSIYSLTVTTSTQGESMLLPKQYDFIREAFSGGSSEGSPRFYAWEDESTLLIGPTPDDAYTIRMSYWGAPDSITSASTSWLGTNQPDLLLYACLAEGYRYLKGSADLMQMYEQKYQQELAKFKIQGEGYDTRDDARNDQHRIPRQ